MDLFIVARRVPRSVLCHTHPRNLQVKPLETRRGFLAGAVRLIADNSDLNLRAIYVFVSVIHVCKNASRARRRLDQASLR